MSKKKARATHLLTAAQTEINKVLRYNSDAVPAAAALEKANRAVDQVPEAERGDLGSSLMGLETGLNTKKMDQMGHWAVRCSWPWTVPPH